MKTLFKVLSVAIAATVLFSCNKAVENPTPETDVRTVQFSAGPVTKTVFGTPSGTTLPTLWTENKTVGISLNLASFKQSTTPVVASGGASAAFSADIKAGTASTFTFYAVSPYSSIINISNTYCSAQVDIPASQTPLATSVDENAQILVAKHVAGSTFPTSGVVLAFEHITAYGKISFSNLTLAAEESIVSVSLTADEDWVGRYYYYLEDHSPYSEGDLAANSVGKTLTLSTSSDTDIWFACAPVDLGGQNIKVVITTNQATTYTKNITIPAGKTFDAGKVNAFTVNMTGISADSAAEYELVTDPTELTAGSHVIIAASGSIATAMSTTQNGNNRGSTSVVKTQSNTVISSPSDAVQVFTVEAGNKASTIAFNTGSGYIYAASSGSNWLRTESTLSDNSSWTVEIDADGVATVVAQGTNARNHLRYNGNNNPPIFACYASSSAQSKVSIYKAGHTTWNLSSIEVTTPPVKTTYAPGDNFDPTGMVVTAHYVDANDATHTKNAVLDNAELTISPSTGLTEGTTSVSISYGGKSTTQPITVTTSGGKADVVIDFTAQGFTSGAQIPEFTVDGVTVTPTTSGNGVKYYSTSPAAIRVYTGNSLTFSCSTHAIKQIVFTYTSGAFKDSSFNSGSYASGSGTWTGSAYSVVANNDTGSQVRISSVTIKFN